MLEDAGTEMKTRLRADLRVALKDRRANEVRAIRALIAALDNAEAPPRHEVQTAGMHHPFGSGSAAEVGRLLLSRSDVQHVMLAEIHAREHAAAELEGLGKVDPAETLRAEALLAKRYLE